MKYLKIILPLCFLLVASSAAFSATEHPKKVYMVGVSASFVDTVAYFSDIQTVENAEFNKKGFLNKRADYSEQLKSYLENNLSLEKRTCMVFFSTQKIKLKAKISKLRHRYEKSHITIKEIGSDSFKFIKP